MNEKVSETHCQSASHQTSNHPNPMLTLLLTPIVAAAGYSLLYLLFGGGLGGAILIFISAKMLGK